MAVPKYKDTALQAILQCYLTSLPMTASQVASDRSNQPFKLWLDVMSFVNVTPRNKEKLTDYFFGKCAGSPEIFFDFLLFLKKALVSGEDEQKTCRIASQYLEIISPLCEKFGMYEEKNLLDEMCFQITHPKDCEDIQRTLEKYRANSEETIANIIQIISKFLKEEGYDCEIKGRYKNAYRIFRKLKKKGYDVPLSLHDILAFRIILNENNNYACFDVLNILHDRFSPIAERFKDYITIPKINGYQSIHTCLNHVVHDLDLPVEVQIRTHIMDEFSERGMASHWLYSSNEKTKLLTQTEKKLLQHFSALSKEAKKEENLYCFSIGGDVYSLPLGATALDFAYSVHTDIGNRAQRVLINDLPQTIGYKIQEGDRIQVIIGEEDHVTKDRLKYAQCPSTRKKIYENTRR